MVDNLSPGFYTVNAAAGFCGNSFIGKGDFIMTEKLSVKKHFTLKQMTLIGLMSALLCVVSPFAIPLPFSPVPLSLATLVLYLSLYVLGTKKALVSCILYLILGTVGLPVFSGATGGIGKLAGPTGGYLIGYLFLILTAGFFVNAKFSNIWYSLLGMVLGTAALYLFGTAWLAVSGHLPFRAALAAGVLPFLPGDALKIILAVLIGPVIRNRLVKVNLL